MSDKKKRDEIHVTPAGDLNWPYLQTPRGFKGDETKLSYDTQLILEGASAAEFAAFVDSKMQEAIEMFPGCPPDAPPIAPVLDSDKKVVDGKTAFKFRVPAKSKGKDGSEWDRKPTIVDSTGNLSKSLMDNERRIGPGSRAKLSFICYIRKNRGAAGITLQPIGVQVLELRELQRSTAALGFKAEAGGFADGGATGSDTGEVSGPAPSGEVPF